MRKIKLDTKSEKSADAFFEIENPYENETLSYVNCAKMSETAKDKRFMGDYKSFKKLLKQVFIFLPGTFLLFFMSFGAAVIAMDIVVFRRALVTLPDDFPFQFALIGLIIFLGTLMTWFGLGDIKNRKHFAIPASIIAAGAIIGAVIKATASISDLADTMLDDFGYLIYLFPLASIIPVLAKSIVDRKIKNA